MNKYLIPIDRSSVRPNPRAGRNDLRVPAKTNKLETQIVDGIAEDYVNGHYVRTYCVDLPDQTIVKYETDYTTVFAITPEPSHLYDYELTAVECCRCGSVFPHTALKSQWRERGTNDVLVKNICPMCHKKECCEVMYEQFKLDS